MMRKSMVAAMAAMLLVLVIAGAAFAQGPGAGAVEPGMGLCLNSSDLDGDGVCDDWIDADGDGVNDAAPLDGTGSQYGIGSQTPQTPTAPAAGQGTAQTGDFVDNDGDGVCDTYVDSDDDGVNDAAPRDGTGSQNGGRGR